MIMILSSVIITMSAICQYERTEWCACMQSGESGAHGSTGGWLAVLGGGLERGDELAALQV